MIIIVITVKVIIIIILIIKCELFSIRSIEVKLQAGFSDIALEFYKQMLSYADRTEDKIKALVSVAETAKELSRYNEAYDCFVEVEHLENTLGICDSKVMHFPMVTRFCFEGRNNNL